MNLLESAAPESHRSGLNSVPATKMVTRATQSKAPAKLRSSRKKTNPRPVTAKRANRGRQTDGSKQDRVIALLQRREGATLDALVKATGWKQHSIRGFLAGTVRKKLKLSLISEKRDGTRTYRIGSGRAAKATKAGAARAA